MKSYLSDFQTKVMMTNSVLGAFCIPGRERASGMLISLILTTTVIYNREMGAHKVYIKSPKVTQQVSGKGALNPGMPV